MKKGEIWLVEIPSSNGHEQAGLRPAVVLSEAEANIVIVIPFTSNLQALRFPNTTKVRPSKKNGLDNISVALVFQVRAIDKRRLKNKIGDLESSTMDEIKKDLKKIIDL